MVPMLRATWLTVQNEARLLIRDPVVLLMLLLAPIVIIAVAGYSLGNVYGGSGNKYRIAIVDEDHGEVARGIIEALRDEPSVMLETVGSADDARRIVNREDRAPLAIEIPAGTTAALESGREAALVLFVDPVRRIEGDALEVRLGELCRTVTARAQATAQKRLAAAQSGLRDKLGRLSASIKQEQAAAREQIGRTRAEIIRSIDEQSAEALAQAGKQIEATIRARQEKARDEMQRELTERESILREIQRYLLELQTSQHAFEDWLTALKAKAGSHASDIPPPPAFPAPPSEADLAQLTKPLTIPTIDASMPKLPAPSINVPRIGVPRGDDLLAELSHFRAQEIPVLPGSVAMAERPASQGAAKTFNAFDQYVPGFGVTFLLIAMLMGISLTLFDEREWGTLKRLRVSGVPVAAVLIGKLIARFLIGTVQMIVLFAIGWALFGISLGRHPAALLLPTVGISFAAAAFGLIIAAIAGSHDAVMPLGTMVAMAMSAIGGCWWPLDFEPGWMRVLARWMPTTWTMQAYNDLMIRHVPAAAVLWPFAATMALGLAFLAAGILLNFRD
jgi:ABC-type multidrug transport system permease subunit